MLTARRTTRAFATGEPITVAELDAVLRYVFGCHGRGSTVPGVVCVKRTSPSGGGLHPIDAYPVVTAVDGIAPGVYHYDAGAHALSPVQRLPAADARQLATEFMAGQSYFGAAAVSIVLSARFDRNHWKYRRHPNAYAGILVDAGALIQTLYLVCTELGLGAFTTIALNGPEIERRLGLDGIHEGAIAIAGCGRRDDAGSPLEMPYGLA
jgi:putative peptide maturation dehydrogenase